MRQKDGSRWGWRDRAPDASGTLLKSSLACPSVRGLLNACVT
jgi:hypothetical protein